ncbi:phage holin family protein [Streptomyces sp. 8K308]|uniref:phage holin family protein n=1 Tax=Streptomyces sp. 8K308 TaxID=2530388 RepID=UPI00104922B2|nr:phage holin family protein [Streptomyces sp. 8K308]TDC20459.1 phage holin family protein [Streptomyces sp. 8K308]
MSLISRRTRQRERAESHDATFGELVADLTSDARLLVRQEMELAKAEMRQEAGRAGRAGGMFGVAAFAAVMVAVFGSLGAMFALTAVLWSTWAALIVAGAWLLIGALMFLKGRTDLRRGSMTPRRTVETLKEDAEWARHPTRRTHRIE